MALQIASKPLEAAHWLQDGDTAKTWFYAFVAAPFATLIVAIIGFIILNLTKMPQQLERLLLGPHWITPRPVGWLYSNELDRRNHKQLMSRLVEVQTTREPVEEYWRKTFEDKNTGQIWTGHLEDTAKSDTFHLEPNFVHELGDSSISFVQRMRRWYVSRCLIEDSVDNKPL